MPKKPKREFTRYQLERRAPVPPRKGGMRPAVAAWVQSFDGDTSEVLRLYDSLQAEERRKLVHQLSAPYRREALRCILHACYRVMPARHSGQTAIYSPRQLAALVLYRWWLGVGHSALMSHLRRHEDERYLIFGPSSRLPGVLYVIEFEPRLTEAIWDALLLALGAVGQGTADAIVLRRKEGI